MAQGKCNLLRPVDNLTGTFFLFSQYTQDLTKQYSNPDSYRCLPSKYLSLDLDYSGIPGVTMEARAKFLGEIFQNYFENACTYLRDKKSGEWNPEDSRTLLFQALQKYGLMKINYSKDGNDNIIPDSGYSDNLHYIGDINIYSYNNNEDGIGYNEIYCYISNEVKSTKYLFNTVNLSEEKTEPYTSNYICGYENKISFNNLSYIVDPVGEIPFIDIFPGNGMNEKGYEIGKFIPLSTIYPNSNGSSYLNTFIPNNLDGRISSDDVFRNLDKFDINAIVVLYDIVQKTETGENTLYKNIPLGIYFTGRIEDDGMTNSITKYVNSGQIYNQGTSYGLRICTRFLASPNSTEIKDISVSGSAVSEIAPVLEKMGETIIAVENSIAEQHNTQTIIKEHLSQFKNNRMNVPYVRNIGDKKYWFVNGKNTGAVAEYEIHDRTDFAKQIIGQVLENVYTKEEIVETLKEYITENQLDEIHEDLASKNYVDEELERLRKELEIYLQGS